MLPKFSWHCFCICLLTCGTLRVAPSAASTEYNRYLAHIFNKYGSGGTMSFEGLEHLMNSLGLGQIEFDPTHTIDEHRPYGYNNKDFENDKHLTQYFEQETIKLLTNDDPDVQIAALKRSNDESENGNGDGIENQFPGSKLMLDFREMHDPKHRHPRENDATFDLPPPSANVCLSPKSLLQLLVDHNDLHKRKFYKTFVTGYKNQHDEVEEYDEFLNNIQLTPVAFMKLCPALLAQLDQQVCKRTAPLSNGEDPKETLWNAWIYASGSIFILSACGLFGVLLVPLMKSIAYNEILNFLVAIAVGTLAGDALMHLLPHALVNDQSHDHDQNLMMNNANQHKHDTGPIWICACTFFTACLMYVLENLLPLLKGDQQHDHHHGHSHGHNHGHKHSHSHVSDPTRTLENLHKSGDDHNTDNHCNNTQSTNSMDLSSSASPAPSSTDIKNIEHGPEVNTMLDELKTDKKVKSRPLTPVAFMVVIGDGLHNLTDGLAIGAAFGTDPVTGMATAFAVLCHELPHELGDFALLLQTGVSMTRAVCLNIVSSVLSFVGMAVGLLLAGLHGNMARWIYAATAGSFLYIAFATLIPAMSIGDDGNKRSFKTMLIQISGILTGGAIMVMIALYEDDLEALFK